MLNDTEVKRIIDAITEYRELVQQSSEMRDQLESLQKRWAALKAERDGLRTSVDALHRSEEHTSDSSHLARSRMPSSA